MARFEFTTASRIIFGAGSIAQIGTLASSFGKRAFVVIGNNPARAETLLARLREGGIETVVYPISSEPTIQMIGAAITTAREAKCDCIVSFGGGSVIDSGKAIAALLTNPGEPLDYLEVIGRGQPITHPALPYIAIPTTAGTGAEVTANAVLASPEHGLKVSLRSAHMLPRIALVDPELTYDLPQKITAYTGMDALTQNIEPFVSNKANPMTDGYAREGIERAGASLLDAYVTGSPTAREDMALASLMGGLALANAKLGAVHGFAGVIGGRFDAPHGAICAVLLPHVMRANITALEIREPESSVLNRYDEIAVLLTGNDAADADDGADWVEELVEQLSIPALSTYGISEIDIAAIVEKSANASSMQGNPIRLTTEEMTEILRAAL